MRRPSHLIPLVVLLVGLVAAGSGAVGAQDATSATGGMVPEGLTFAPLGIAFQAALPSPADLTVARAGIAPGAGFPFDASDPEGALVVVESGALTIRVEEQAWTISRGGALERAMATPAAEPDMTGVLEEVAMGAEGTLQAGDVAYIPGNLTGEVRNDGQEQASALLFLIRPSGTMGAATPEATPPA